VQEQACDDEDSHSDPSSIQSHRTHTPSLSVHAEPFSGRAPAVPLSLAHLPSSLTRLELRHVDVADHPDGERTG